VLLDPGGGLLAPPPLEDPGGGFLAALDEPGGGLLAALDEPGGGFLALFDEPGGGFLLPVLPPLGGGFLLDVPGGGLGGEVVPAGQRGYMQASTAGISCPRSSLLLQFICCKVDPLNGCDANNTQTKQACGGLLVYRQPRLLASAQCKLLHAAGALGYCTHWCWMSTGWCQCCCSRG
jgi:hypothetical protein